MNIFSELYGTYFRIAEKLMEKERTTEKEIRDLIGIRGFRDSVLFLPQKLIPQKDGSDWGLFRKKEDGSIVRVVKNKPVPLMTTLQKMWLKAKLYDPKMRLFLENKTISALEERLSDVHPLYDSCHFRYTDIFSDGDNFSDSEYCRYFRIILDAIKKHQVLSISFKSGHERRIRGRYLPLKIQYSQKNDKFRLFCYSIRQGKTAGSGIINLGRIISVQPTGIIYEKEISTEKFFMERTCKTPVTVRVTNERNGVERFMAEFASYEKRTERDLKTGSCTVNIWFDKQDETELLIRLLSFGPVLEITGPPDFRAQAAERVKRQAQLLSD